MPSPFTFAATPVDASAPGAITCGMPAQAAASNRVGPADSVPPIIYPIGLTASSKNPDAPAFVTYLSGPDATKQFDHYGFTVLGAAH